MSKTLGNLLYKIVIGVIIVAIVIGVRDMILTDSSVSAFFGQLLGELPFAKAVSEPVMKILGFRTTIPYITAKSFTGEMLKLAVMACLQPLVMGIAYTVFLPVPRIPRSQILATPYPSYYEAERYTESFGYKIKELLLNLILCPPLAILSGWLIGKGQDYLELKTGAVIGVLIGLGVLAVAFALSLLPLLFIGVALGTALLWRAVVTLLAQMANMMMLDALCIAVYIAFLSGIWSNMAGSITVLVVYVIAFDIFLTAMRQIIVS